MGLTLMSFDKNWNNYADFPTHESQEAKVRADMQYLFDSIKNQFNNFLQNELFANNIPYSAGAGILADNIQDAIDAIQAEIESISQGSVADGSISTVKLDQTVGSEAVTSNTIRDGAVITSKIYDGAVTTSKISDGAINEAKLGTDSVHTVHISDGAVGTAEIADGAVKTAKIYIGAVTDEKLASNSVIEAKIADSAVTTAKIYDGAVTTAKIKDANVTTAKIKDGNVTAAKLCQTAGSEAVITAAIRDANVTTAKLADSAVTTAKIADGNVTTAKLDTTLQNTINGKAPIAHAVNANTYGLGTSGVYGHLKLSDATNGTQNTTSGVAATPAAVKAAYDLAAGKASTSHASSATTYGVGNSSNYGHLKLSAATNSTSGDTGGIAATPSAVKAAYDLAAGKAPTAHASTGTGYGIGTGSNYGHVKLSDATNSTSAAASGIAASPAAVKAAYDLAAGKAAASHTSVAAADTTLGHAKISKGTCTLATNANAWSNVALSGATCNSNSLIICAPAPASYAQWVDNRVRCTGQGTNVLTFAADTKTTAAITVNVFVIKF